jgi:hypothetical protein
MPSLTVNVASTAVILCSPGPTCNYVIVNEGNATAYISNNASVTITTGFPLTPGSRMVWVQPYNANISTAPTPVYGITQATAANFGPVGTTLSVTGTAI